MKLIEDAEHPGAGRHEGLIDQLPEGVRLDPVQLFDQSISLRHWHRSVPVEVEAQALSPPGHPQQLPVKSLVPSVGQAQSFESAVESDSMTIALRFCERAVDVEDHRSKHG